MREIKFRGKRVDNGEWVYGSLVLIDNTSAIVQNQLEWMDGSELRGGDWHYVIHESVGQFTGLYDKNGKEIYEGDIHEYIGLRFTIKFGYYTEDNTQVEMYGWYLDLNNRKEQWSFGVDSEKYVNIIGNIH